MNRNEEFTALVEELQETPPELAYTVQRAAARRKKSRRLGRFLGIPVGSLAVFFVSFTLLVNLLPTFARACGGIPVLRELALAVAWSPSLSAAVENDYVQPMDLEQTQNDITARIEYVIVDQKQLNIFYTLNSKVYPRLESWGLEMADREGYSASSASFGLENGELGQFTLNFEDAVPDSLTFTLPVHQWEDHGGEPPEAPSRSYEEEMLEEDWARSEEPDILAEFTFTLTFDPWYTAQGEIIALDETIALEGQTITLTDVEIYPTHMRLKLADNEGNTAWLRDIDYYLENERGERFEGVKNGVSATGDFKTNGEKSYHMDSAFFSESQHLTLYIQRAYWLDHGKETFRVNLERGTADWLPQGVALQKVTQAENGWVIGLLVPTYRENHLYSFIYAVHDAAGAEFHPGSSSASFYEEGEGELTDRFLERIPLRDYPDTEVYLEPYFSRVTEYETPIAVTLK